MLPKTPGAYAKQAVIYNPTYLSVHNQKNHTVATKFQKVSSQVSAGIQQKPLFEPVSMKHLHLDEGVNSTATKLGPVAREARLQLKMQVTVLQILN
jgi:hypothetical protein